jgi:hypothetical protein
MANAQTGMINGDIISGCGGYIAAWAYNGNGPDSNETRLDVSQWEIQELFHNAECTTTGCMGAMNHRRVVLGYRFKCSIPFDLTQLTPRIMLKSCNTVQLRFNLGNPAEGQYPPGYGVGFWQYYFSPAALLEEVHTISNAAKDVIRVDCTGIGASHMFLCGGLDGNNETGLLQAYLTAQARRGWHA